MKILITLLSTTVILFLSLVVAGEQVTPKDHIRHHVNIYAFGSSQSPEVGELLPGNSLPFIRKTSRWNVVELPNGNEGFVSRSHTRIMPSEVQARAENELRLHYLNVGPGMCTLVECPGPDAPPMLIDCGSLGQRGNDLTEAKARAYIENILSNHSSKPNVVISHPHKDHYGWVPSVLASTQVNNIWLGGDPNGYTLNNFPEWLEKQKGAGATVHEQVGSDFHNNEEAMDPSKLGCGLADVFTLTVNTGSDTNGNSHVLEISYDTFGATFTGDAIGETENQALENYAGNVKTTVLSASHHGSASHKSNGQQWIDATDPEVVIFSSGHLFNHPVCAVVERYDDVLADAPAHPTRCGSGGRYQYNQRTTDAKYVTAVNGLIVVTSDGDSPLVLTCSETEECNAEIPHD